MTTLTKFMEDDNIFLHNVDNVYYRLMIKGSSIRMVCMQDFDEYDYDQSKFISPKMNELECEVLKSRIEKWCDDKIIAALKEARSS